MEVANRSNDGQIENIRVFVRVRPATEKEKREYECAVSCEGDNTILLKRGDKVKSFKFNKIFDQSSSQIEIYCSVAVPIVNKVLQGYNGTIFAYGQSGTGKTYTMIGDPVKSNFKGIVPNIFSHIFTQIAQANHEVSYIVTVTFLEIYNEEVRDLLSRDPKKKLLIRERSDVGVYVKDLLGFTVNSMECITDLLIRGNKNRSTGSTKLNDVSSRSHAIFSIIVESKSKTNGKTLFGKLNLVDLAGSERVNRTHASGDRLREAGKINLSLSVLGNVISALIDGKCSHIPYRNSKLTRLLQDSLGGSSMTAMISMVSPSELDYEETLYTLMYADRVKHIQNYVTANKNQEGLLEKFQQKILDLQSQLDSISRSEQSTPKEKKKKQSTPKNDEELEKLEMMKKSLKDRISTIQNKILIGGENLLEKAQYQMNLLAHTSEELESLDNSHLELQEILYFKSKSSHKMKQEYSSLQEEDKDISRKILQTQQLLKEAKEMCVKKEQEYQSEINSLLFDNKCLARKMSLANFVIHNCIPDSELSKITSNIVYDSDIQEWLLRGEPHTGNNLKKRKSKLKDNVKWKTKQVYNEYQTK